MQIFKDIGNQVEKVWKEKNYDINEFPSIACGALQLSDLSQVNADEISAWTFTATDFPVQAYLDSRFGEPPLTVFSTDKFYIEILFWLSGTTAIHEHAFRGAFYVLHGSSIHTTFEFSEHTRINEHLRVGKLQVTKTELLRKGQFHAIEGGGSFIHSLFHLDHPSISLVIRTYNDPVRAIQFAYRPPALAVNEFYKDARIIKQTQMLRMHKMTGSVLFTTLLDECRRRNNLHALTQILINLSHENLITPDELRFVQDKAFEQHGEIVNSIFTSFPEIFRVNTIQQSRKFIKDPNHRFFLAVMMNAQDTAQVREIIKSQFAHDEIDLIVQWISELGGDGKLGVRFNDFQLDIIRSVITVGDDINAIIAYLKNIYEDNDIESKRTLLLELHSKIKAIPLFKPFFNNK